MIERIPKSHRYRVTDFGFRAYSLPDHARLYRWGLRSAAEAAERTGISNLQQHIAKIEA